MWFESNFCTGRYAAWLRASEKFGSNQIFAQGDMQLGLELVKNLVRIKFLHREICSLALSCEKFGSNQIFAQGDMQLGLELVKNLVRIKFLHREICSLA